jgi:hypothetical protein
MKCLHPPVSDPEGGRDVDHWIDQGALACDSVGLMLPCLGSPIATGIGSFEPEVVMIFGSMVVVAALPDSAVIVAICEYPWLYWRHSPIGCSAIGFQNAVRHRGRPGGRNQHTPAPGGCGTRVPCLTRCSSGPRRRKVFDEGTAS